MASPRSTDGGDRPDGPATRAEFEHALDELCRRASLNGVEVGFGIDLRHRDDVPDWEVEITPLGKPGEK